MRSKEKTYIPWTEICKDLIEDEKSKKPAFEATPKKLLKKTPLKMEKTEKSRDAVSDLFVGVASAAVKTNQKSQKLEKTPNFDFLKDDEQDAFAYVDEDEVNEKKSTSNF